MNFLLHSSLLLFISILVNLSLCEIEVEEEMTSGLYDAASAIESRTAHYKRMCAKFKDPRRPEYEALFSARPIDTNKLFRNLKKNLFICAPPKVASRGYFALMKLNLAQDYLSYGKEAMTEFLDATKAETTGELFKKGQRLMTVRHPLERILSSYFLIFLDTSMHRDLTRKLKNDWLHRRSDALNAVEGEDLVDAEGEPTLTFRQFVNFLINCPREAEDCKVMSSGEGLARHWAPFWKFCQPCKEGQEYDFVSELTFAREDKTYIFDRLGMNNSLPFPLATPSKRAASTIRAKRKYFGQLTEAEIRMLHEKYKLDHDLFGYSPDEYLAMAKH